MSLCKGDQKILDFLYVSEIGDTRFCILRVSTEFNHISWIQNAFSVSDLKKGMLEESFRQCFESIFPTERLLKTN